MTSKSKSKTAKVRAKAKPGSAAKTKKKSARQSARSKPAGRAQASASAAINRSSVAVVGGGISGLASAVRLLKAGFDVTVFEKSKRLGGNMSSSEVNGVEHDVYPHMFPEWYDNFWNLFENDLGLDRAAHFSPRPGVKMLEKGSGDYTELFNPSSLDAVFANLKSGLLSPAEMLLTGYSTLDISGYPVEREGFNQLDKLDVNGLLYSTGYVTEDVATMQNYMLQVIWSIQSERTAAATYQDFLRHTLTFPDGAPFAYMLKGSLNDKLIEPIRQLIERLGGVIHTQTEVTSVRLEADQPTLWARSETVKSAGKKHSFDQIILAVPPRALNSLVMGDSVVTPGDTLISRETSLAQVRRLKSVAIPVLNLYLNRALPDFPAESIGLSGAQYGLSVLDIAQLWPSDAFDGKTALVVAASDGEALPADDPEGQGRAILEELVKFYPDINIGKRWGDPDSDVDWTKTYARTNDDYGLFLNEVGSWDWRPKTEYPDTLPGIFFAGDLAQSVVDMATIEAAIESGLLAAQAIQQYDAAQRNGEMRGAPIKLVKHTTYGDSALRGAKLALMPFAYMAKFLADRRGSGRIGLRNLGNALQSEHTVLLPMIFATDWWTTVYWFWRSVFDDDQDGPTTGPGNHDDDNFIGLGAALLMVAGEFAAYAGEKCAGSQPYKGADNDSQARPGDALAGLAMRAGQLAAEFLGKADKQAVDPNRNGGQYKRRWRPKR